MDKATKELLKSSIIPVHPDTFKKMIELGWIDKNGKWK